MQVQQQMSFGVSGQQQMSFGVAQQMSFGTASGDFKPRPRTASSRVLDSAKERRPASSLVFPIADALLDKKPVPAQQQHNIDKFKEYLKKRVEVRSAPARQRVAGLRVVHEKEWSTSSYQHPNHSIGSSVWSYTMKEMDRFVERLRNPGKANKKRGSMATMRRAGVVPGNEAVLMRYLHALNELEGVAKTVPPVILDAIYKETRTPEGLEVGAAVGDARIMKKSIFAERLVSCPTTFLPQAFALFDTFDIQHREAVAHNAFVLGLAYVRGRTTALFLRFAFGILSAHQAAFHPVEYHAAREALQRLTRTVGGRPLYDPFIADLDKLGGLIDGDNLQYKDLVHLVTESEDHHFGALRPLMMDIMGQ